MGKLCVVLISGREYFETKKSDIEFFEELDYKVEEGKYKSVLQQFRKDFSTIKTTIEEKDIDYIMDLRPYEYEYLSSLASSDEEALELLDEKERIEDDAINLANLILQMHDVSSSCKAQELNGTIVEAWSSDNLEDWVDLNYSNIILAYNKHYINKQATLKLVS